MEDHSRVCPASELSKYLREVVPSSGEWFYGAERPPRSPVTFVAVTRNGEKYHLAKKNAKQSNWRCTTCYRLAKSGWVSNVTGAVKHHVGCVSVRCPDQFMQLVHQWAYFLVFCKGDGSQVQWQVFVIAQNFEAPSQRDWERITPFVQYLKEKTGDKSYLRKILCNFRTNMKLVRKMNLLYAENLQRNTQYRQKLPLGGAELEDQEGKLKAIDERRTRHYQSAKWEEEKMAKAVNYFYAKFLESKQLLRAMKAGHEEIARRLDVERIQHSSEYPIASTSKVGSFSYIHYCVGTQIFDNENPIEYSNFVVIEGSAVLLFYVQGFRWK